MADNSPAPTAVPAQQLSTPAPPQAGRRVTTRRDGEPSSWGEALRQYEAEKRTAQVQPSQIERFTRARGRPPCTWNPLISAPADVKERMALSLKEKNDAAKSVTQGLQRDLDASFVAYNVLNFSPKFGLTAQQADECLNPHRTSGLRQSRPVETPFNIINLQQKTHLPPVREVFHLKQGEFSQKWHRDFDVINGDYHEDNAKKRQDEADRSKVALLHRVAESEEYHPITGRYYNVQKEAALQAGEQRLLETKKAQLHVIDHPLTAAHGEGAAYNILSGKEYDSGKCEALVVRDNANLMAISELRQRHATACDRVDDRMERLERSALRRHQRPEAVWDNVSHGYDVVNAKPFGLTNGELKVCPDGDRHAQTLRGLQAPPVPLRLFRPVTVADRLQRITEKRAEAEAQESWASMHCSPLTSFEKTMNMPATFPASKQRFRKSAQAPVTGAADFTATSL
eukprot:GGOE01045223.1.p1 GENE.GGOE01045223.1~~GGOE01045223.1.p1  ORF type:complete len:484 (+),score=129.87 GGOE01045223.1:86-1453(+)